MQLSMDDTLLQAIEFHKIGNIEEANRYYSSILKVNPNHSDANHNLGLLYLNEGDFISAYEYLENALQSNYDVPQFWLSFIDVLIKLKLKKDAKKFFMQAQLRGFTNSLDFEELEKKLFGSTSSINRSEKLQTEPDNNQLDFVVDLFRNNEFETVLGLAEQLVEDFPNSATLFHLIGATYSKLNDFKQAIKKYEIALKLSPHDSIIYNDIGNALKELGQYKKALKHFRLAKKISPECIIAFKNIADTYMQMNNYKLAIRYLKNAIKLDPEKAFLHLSLSKALELNGSNNLAVKSLKTAKLLDPDIITEVF